jgi:hypothetical protein
LLWHDLHFVESLLLSHFPWNECAHDICVESFASLLFRWLALKCSLKFSHGRCWRIGIALKFFVCCKSRKLRGWLGETRSVYTGLFKNQIICVFKDCNLSCGAPIFVSDVVCM